MTGRERAIDHVRRYWDKRPCNVRHSRRPVGSRAYYDEVADRRYTVEPHIMNFAQFGFWSGKFVLEVGCGIGTDAIRFAQAGAQVTAVDLSKKSLKIAKRGARAYGVADRMEFYQGNAEYLTGFVPVESHYNLIYCWGMLHHTPQPERVIEQMRHYARPGTMVKVMVYHKWSYKNLMVKLGLAQPEAQAGVPVARTYTRAGAEALLWPFQVTEAFVNHIFPYRVADYIQYRYVKAWPWRITPPALFRRLERRFGWHLCLTGRAP